MRDMRDTLINNGLRSVCSEFGFPCTSCKNAENAILYEQMVVNGRTLTAL